MADLIGSHARISDGRVDGQVADSVGRLRDLRADSMALAVHACEGEALTEGHSLISLKSLDHFKI